MLAARSADEVGYAATLGLLRLFARTAPDGVTLAASLAVLVTDGPLRDPRGQEFHGGPPPPLEKLSVGGEPTGVFRENSIRSSVSFRAADGRAVAVIADHLDDAQLATVAASVRTAEPTTGRPALPAGFGLVHTGPWPSDSGPQRALRQDWEDVRVGRSLTMTIDVSGNRSLASLAWDTFEARAAPVTVRGHRGILTGMGVLPTLAWMERPDTLVSIAGNGLDAEAVKGIAEDLQVVDEAAWRAAPIGPITPFTGVPVASGVNNGVAWEATAGLTPSMLGIPAGACLHVTGILSTCSPPPTQMPALSAVDVRPRADGRARFLTAALDRRVARVTITYRDGTTAEVTPVGDAIDLPAVFVIVELAPGIQPTGLSAFDASGRELGSVAIPPPPEGGYATPAP